MKEFMKALEEAETALKRTRAWRDYEAAIDKAWEEYRKRNPRTKLIQYG